MKRFWRCSTSEWGQGWWCNSDTRQQTKAPGNRSFFVWYVAENETRTWGVLPAPEPAAAILSEPGGRVEGSRLRSILRTIDGAEEGTRTPTPLRVHGPEPCASANSATSARDATEQEPRSMCWQRSYSTERVTAVQCEYFSLFASRFSLCIFTARTLSSRRHPARCERVRTRIAARIP